MARTTTSASKSRLSEEERQRIVALYTKDGLSFKRIAEEVNRNFVTIRRILIEENAQIRSGLPDPLTDEQKDTIVEAYRGGQNAKQVAKAFGCHACTVRSILKERGVQPRSNTQIQAALHVGDGFDHISKHEMFRKEESAGVKGIHWGITAGDIERVYQSQDGKCYYSGIKMDWANTKGDHDRLLKGNPLAMSIDRKDSDLGYTPDNIALCCRFINYAKNSYSETLFKSLLAETVQSLAPKPEPAGFNPWEFGV